MKIEVSCKNCNVKFFARVADRKRGWGRFCSKSCKAIKQENRTGQCKKYYDNARNYLNSGVSKDKFIRYQNQYGDSPQFSNSGEFEGISGMGFDNCSHQDSEVINESKK